MEFGNTKKVPASAQPSTHAGTKIEAVIRGISRNGAIAWFRNSEDLAARGQMRSGDFRVVSDPRSPKQLSSPDLPISLIADGMKNAQNVATRPTVALT